MNKSARDYNQASPLSATFLGHVCLSTEQNIFIQHTRKT